MKHNMIGKAQLGVASVALCALVASGAVVGCSTAASSSSAAASSGTSAEASASAASSSGSSSATKTTLIQEGDINISSAIANAENGGHAILADGENASYSNTAVSKTGESSGDNADFYGENAAIFATNGATLDLSNMVVKTDGTHANAVFSYGNGTVVNISDSVIETAGNCSGGLMTTGGGTMNANNLNIATTGNSSAAIRSDRGGGIVNVTGGQYTTAGKGSPAIYSTADITVNDATLVSTSAQGVVIEGKNSVTLNNVDLTASNVSKNSDKSPWYQAVMIYQSMSGDAAEGASFFTMDGGTLKNTNGDIFFVNNTVTTINLTNAAIENQDASGNFLRAAAAGWGNEGKNGGQVTLNASRQTIDGNMLVDSVSHLNLYLADGSTFTGAINPDGQEGEVYVDLSGGSTWTLTADSYITSLTCDAASIDLNGHTLYVNGVAYTAGSASTGTAIETVVYSGGGMGGSGGSMPPDGGSSHGGPSGMPPSSGASSSGGQPPEKR